MSYATESQIRSLSRLAKSVGGLLKEAVKSASGKYVFLSHSHLDRDLLGGLITLINSFEATVYLDHEDDELPAVPSLETAALLRERIDNCPRFILAASQNIRSSRWTPWEIGLADGLKGFLKIAIFPLIPDGAKYTGVEQEYLDTYPRIEHVTFKGEHQQTWVVRDPRDGACWTMEEWLH